jgi:hypothetical protein
MAHMDGSGTSDISPAVSLRTQSSAYYVWYPKAPQSPAQAECSPASDWLIIVLAALERRIIQLYGVLHWFIIEKCYQSKMHGELHKLMTRDRVCKDCHSKTHKSNERLEGYHKELR